MKKLLFVAFAAVALALIQGCASTQVADKFNGQDISTTAGAANIAHVNGQNWGLYCLSIPLITGSTTKPGSVVWMQDTVNVKSVTDMVTAKTKSLGSSSTLDISSSRSGIWIMPTFVLFINSVEVSGNGVK